MTQAGVALLLLRLMLGQIFVLHGSQKAFVDPRPRKMEWVLLGFIEFIVGISMILGLFTALASAIIIVIMAGAVMTKIFVWPRQKYAVNMEFDLLILVSAVVILVLGPGIWALYG